MPRTLLRQPAQHPAGSTALTLDELTTDFRKNDRFFLHQHGIGKAYRCTFKAIVIGDGDTYIAYEMEGFPKFKPVWLLGLTPCDGEWNSTYVTRHR